MASSEEPYKKFFRGCLDRGVYFAPSAYWVSLIQRRVVLPRCVGAFRVGGFCADSLGSARGAEIFGTCGAHWQGGIRGAELKFCREK